MILDTFKVTDGRIFLKELHIERSLEACLYLNKNMIPAHLISIYEKIESRYQDTIISLKINPFCLSDWQSNEKIIEPFSEPVLLSLSYTAHLIQSSPFKWADRQCWDELLKKKSAQAQDILLAHPDGLIRETTRFNIFILDRQTQSYFTPSLESGCVNGALRRWLLQRGLEKGPVLSAPIFASQLEDSSRYELFVGNSVRGLLRAELV